VSLRDYVTQAGDELDVYANTISQHSSRITVKGGDNTAPITAVTALTITDLAATNDYIITLEGFAPTDDSEDLWMRWSIDGGATYEDTTGDYQWFVTSQNVTDQRVSDAQINLSSIVFGNDADLFSTIEITLINPGGTDEQLTTFWSGFGLDDKAVPEIGPLTGGARFIQGTTAVNAVQFIWRSGSTFKAQGNIKVKRRTLS